MSLQAARSQLSGQTRFGSMSTTRLVSLAYESEGFERTVILFWVAALKVVLETAGDPRKLYERPSTFTNPDHPKVCRPCQAQRAHTNRASRTSPFQNWGHVVRAVPVFAL